MKEHVEKFNETIKNTLLHLVKELERQEGSFQEIRAGIKDFWPDYRGDVLFIVGSLPEREEFFNIEVLTETGISDSSQFYSGNHETVLNFLRDPSSLGIIIEKVRNMGMYLLIEEDRRFDSSDEWE